MSRVMALILIVSLWIPAQGQSGPNGARDRSTQFTPRGRPTFSTQNPSGANGQLPSQAHNPKGFEDRTPPAYQGRPAHAVSGFGGAGLGGGVGREGPLLDARGVRAAKGRLPNGFGQLGLSQDQRERVYGIRELYRGEIDRLEAVIERLKAEEELQYQQVLSPTQRQLYLQYQQTK